MVARSPISLLPCLGLLTLALACASPTGSSGAADVPTTAADGQAADSQPTDTALTDSQATASDVVTDAADPDAALAVDVASADAGGAADTCVALATSGAPPEKTVAAPTFSDVLTHEGVGADPAALKGKWTVMWFYPAATTAG